MTQGNFGEFLQQKRAKIGEQERLGRPISRADAAERCQLTYAEYRWMEERSKIPGPEEAQKISQGMGIPILELLAILGYIDSTPAILVVEELELTQNRWRKIANLIPSDIIQKPIILHPSTRRIRIRAEPSD